MEEKIPVLVICGPTASGKTGLAVQLAQRLEGEIVSADSMQIYRRMNIGTAKPTPEEMKGVPHHLLDFLDPERAFSVAEYVKLAAAAIRDIHSRGRLPLLAGGTGLYIQTLIDNIQFFEAGEDTPLRKKLIQLAESQGNQALWEELRDCDPDLAHWLHPNNRGRVIRGIEVFRLTGVPLTEWQRRSRLEPSPYRPCIIGLDYRDRQALYQRIDQRVDRMLESGLLREARMLWETTRATASQAIGYKELFAYFDGEQTLEEGLERIKRETRRYAKRQLTWFRRDGRVHWLYVDDYQTETALLADALALARQG